MAAITTIPVEILDLFMDHLVLDIGIQKAVLLRTVSKSFDSAILRAICLRQVVSIDDPATDGLKYRLEPRLKGRIVAARSQRAVAESDSCLFVVRNVNSALDAAMGDLDPDLLNIRHEAVASAVHFTEHPADSKLDLLNLLSGAAATGTMHVVQSLVETGDVNVNATTPFFPAALTLAASRGDAEMVRYLLQNGARLDSVCEVWSKTAGLATQADWNKNDEARRYFVLTRHPPSALRAAVSGGHELVVHLLLQVQHRLPVDSLEYLRALVVGSGVGHIDIIHALLHTIDKKISDFDGLGNEMLWEASRYKHRSVVEMLMDQGIDINAFPGCYPRRFSTALHQAASFGHMDMVRFLISRGADVQFPGQGAFNELPIKGAAFKGQADTVDLLLAHGADATGALDSAAKGGQTRIIRRLLNKYPSLVHCESGTVGMWAFLRAWSSRNLTVMTLLVEAGVSLNHGWDRAPFFGSPMSLSKRDGSEWVVQHLRSLGAEETEEDFESPHRENDARGIRVSERTWEWVSKY